MEQKYWEQFTKTGGVCEYLGYKMEVYGHRGCGKTEAAQPLDGGEDFESDRSNRDGAFYGTGRGV